MVYAMREDTVARKRPRRCEACEERPATVGGMCGVCAKLTKYGHRGLGLGEHDPRLASEPTDTPPGSMERMRVYQQRLKAGRAIFHPLDDNSGETWCGEAGVKLFTHQAFKGESFRSGDRTELDDEEDEECYDD